MRSSAWLLTGDWAEYHVLGLLGAWLTLGAAPPFCLFHVSPKQVLGFPFHIISEIRCHQLEHFFG